MAELPPVIADDFECTSCRYNLRGLSVDRSCPECGVAIQWSCRRATKQQLPNVEEIREFFRRRRGRAVAEKANCSTDAVLFIYYALVWAQSAAEFDATSEWNHDRDHVDPRRVCRALRDHAKFYFHGDLAEATELLNEWGICSSTNVGRIIYAMIDARWLKTSDTEPADFNGLFELATLFTAEI